MSEKLEWALRALHNKAYGGEGGFELDEIYPTLKREISLLKAQADKLREALDNILKDPRSPKVIDYSMNALKEYDEFLNGPDTRD